MILKLVRARRGEAGIIYCLSRKAAEATAEFLAGRGVRASAYHAGMTSEQRARTQETFNRDDLDVVCATIAFGMGIDKSNVRFVIHRDMPRSIEGYYQEIGRAGRDGATAECVLFYSWADVISLDRLIENSDAPDAEVSEQQRRAVRRMFDLADAAACSWRRLAAYFAEDIEACAESCGNCLGRDIVASARTVPEPAKKIARSKTRAGFDEVLPAEASLSGIPALGLFESLRALRKRLADERQVPAYVVFSDRTLQAMAVRKPRTHDEFLEVHGVGQKKLEEYGDAFIAEIRRQQD
jgi:ATP-dependent DNA helicase RecQ